MAITVLSQASSLNAGSDLWILPLLQNSRAVQKLDWYLNFQLSRASLHHSKDLALPLHRLLEKTGLPEEYWGRDSQNCLMISTSALLPNRWLVQIEEKNDLPAWCGKISEVWTKLNRPSLRIFLPTGLNAGEFQNLWKQGQSFDDFTLVVD